MTQSTFSKRYGYISSNDCVIRESLPDHIKNAIQNCFTELFINYNISSTSDKLVADFGRYFLNLRIKNNQHKLFAPLEYVDNCDYLEWYEQIDVFEWTFNYHFEHLNEQDIQCLNNCIIELNKELERHHYAYRVINGLFIEVTSDIELEAIEKSLSTNENIKVHLLQAISSISASNQVPDYRNSIKESISAVGCFLRGIFGGNSLGEALKNLRSKHPNLINQFVLSAIEKIYTYTNQPNTGIRHELLTQNYIPDHSDAIFMLTEACCVINYISKKLSINYE